MEARSGVARRIAAIIFRSAREVKIDGPGGNPGTEEAIEGFRKYRQRFRFPPGRERTIPVRLPLFRRRGFVLLDALIGMMIGVFALVSILPLVIATLGSSDVGEQNAIAYGATRRIIENIRMYKGDTFASGNYSATAFGAVPQLDQLKDSAAVVTLGTHTEKLKRVTIIVSWRSGNRGGRTRTFETVTLVGSRGVTP